MRFLEKLSPLALLLLRCGLGIIFISHGWPKLAHPQQAFEFFRQSGFPGYFAYVAGVLEFFGGLLLIAGLFTRIAGLLLACEMAVAIWKVILPHATYLSVGQYQLELALATGAFALATVGAGAISIDHLVFGGGRASRKPLKEKR